MPKLPGSSMADSRRRAAPSRSKSFSFLTAIFLLAVPALASAAMSSSRYSIYADAVGVSGIVVGTSTSYTLTDTVGETSPGTVTSTSYEVRGGFQSAEQDETLSFTLNDSSLAFAEFNRAQPGVASVTTAFSVTCNAITGYSVSITGVSGSMPSAVGDGAVTAGEEEYGFTATGADSQLTTDVSVVSGRVIASNSSPVIGAGTTLIFKASIAPGSAAGTYSQSITLTASANF